MVIFTQLGDLKGGGGVPGTFAEWWSSTLGPGSSQLTQSTLWGEPVIGFRSRPCLLQLHDLGAEASALWSRRPHLLHGGREDCLLP